MSISPLWYNEHGAELAVRFGRRIGHERRAIAVVRSSFANEIVSPSAEWLHEAQRKHAFDMITISLL
jgi:hypothetical protein